MKQQSFAKSLAGFLDMHLACCVRSSTLEIKGSAVAQIPKDTARRDLARVHVDARLDFLFSRDRELRRKEACSWRQRKEDFKQQVVLTLNDHHLYGSQRLGVDRAGHDIYVADIDMISDFFFQQRSMQNIENIEFDNVTFVLNAVDFLASFGIAFDRNSLSMIHSKILMRRLSRFGITYNFYVEVSHQGISTTLIADHLHTGSWNLKIVEKHLF